MGLYVYKNSSFENLYIKDVLPTPDDPDTTKLILKSIFCLDMILNFIISIINKKLYMEYLK